MNQGYFVSNICVQVAVTETDFLDVGMAWHFGCLNGNDKEYRRCCFINDVPFMRRSYKQVGSELRAQGSLLRFPAETQDGPQIDRPAAALKAHANACHSRSQEYYVSSILSQPLSLR